MFSLTLLNKRRWGEFLRHITSLVEDLKLEISAFKRSQEELTMQVCDLLESLVEPRGIAVLIEASHMCCSIRGVKDQASKMVTSEVRGLIRTESSIKDEFYRGVELTR